MSHRVRSMRSSDVQAVAEMGGVGSEVGDAEA